ncbi:hypothetical protein GCM10009133_16170 [Cocleimonas flava]|uniref:Uncharacterized protein n=1 Tax=Cocleimonas flava TaxID=634765 RepID=A0A4R1ESJ1_9GAMM|nr:hypothetical protein [Cocleimonas flava]TCJ84547.1 hypothetical protein EV695_2504 [Cocleimonas flava]
MKFPTIFCVLLLFNVTAIADKSGLYNNLKDSYWLGPYMESYITFDKNHMISYRISDHTVRDKIKYSILSENSFKIIAPEFPEDGSTGTLSNDLQSIKLVNDSESFVIRKVPYLTQTKLEGIWETVPYKKDDSDTQVEVQYTGNQVKFKRIIVNHSNNTHSQFLSDSEYSISKGFIFDTDEFKYYAIEKKGDKILYSSENGEDDSMWFEQKLSKPLAFKIPSNSKLIKENQ